MNRLPITDPTPLNIGLVIQSFACLMDCEFVHCIDARVVIGPLSELVDLVVHYDTCVKHYRHRSFTADRPWNWSVGNTIMKAVQKHDADTQSHGLYPIEPGVICRSLRLEHRA